MKLPPLIHSFFALWLLLLSGCALLSRPAPLVTLQLEPPPTTSTWPTLLRPGRVTAIAALQSDRVVVTDGALLMQHQGLRWVEVPAVMVTEYLHRIHARRSADAAQSEAGAASLDLWITDFSLHLVADGGRIVVVAASAQLRCASTASLQPLAPAAATFAPPDDSARAIAAAFSAATREVITRLLSAAPMQREPCSPDDVDRSSGEHEARS
jgi:ABC-type uncharacterized transport system auxiliary subunit